jgi:FkbM family methyltransferase
VRADPTRVIGRSIWTTGVYDLAVSEVLVRLITPGDTVIDAGANVGYMTLLVSVAAGPDGRVLCYEPHPALFAVLAQNVSAARAQFALAQAELYNAALGERPGTAELLLPEDFGSNDGTARIASAADSPEAPRFSVPMLTLDDALGDGTAAVLKLDVEGFELTVLRGARLALAARRIRHIVFEDHAVIGSEVVQFLRNQGYQVYSVGWSMRGVSLCPVEAGNMAKDYEPPNFVASVDTADLVERCRPGGWSVLSTRLSRRCT